MSTLIVAGKFDMDGGRPSGYIAKLAAHVPHADVVLCKVRGTQYLHLVSAVKPGQVQISNNQGHVNGWTPSKNVFGILTKVQP